MDSTRRRAQHSKERPHNTAQAAKAMPCTREWERRAAAQTGQRTDEVKRQREGERERGNTGREELGLSPHKNCKNDLDDQT